MSTNKRGPLASGFQASRQKYKCPVKDCNSEFRGDDIAKHFRKCANLLALTAAIEKQSLLKESSTPSDTIEISEDYLHDLLKQDSQSEKSHTLFLFQHDFSSLFLFALHR